MKKFTRMRNVKTFESGFEPSRGRDCKNVRDFVLHATPSW